MALTKLYHDIKIPCRDICFSLPLEAVLPGDDIRLSVVPGVDLRSSVVLVPCTRELVCSSYFPRNRDSKHPVSGQQIRLPKSWVTDLESLDLMGYTRTGVAVANIGLIACSDAVKAAVIDGYGTAVSNIGPKADSGLSISDLLGYAPLSSVTGRYDNGFHPEVSILGQDDGDFPLIRILSGSGKGFSGKGNSASLVGVDLQVLLGRGFPQVSDPDVRCSPGMVLPKSWVPDPGFRSVRAEASEVGSVGVDVAGKFAEVKIVDASLPKMGLMCADAGSDVISEDGGTSNAVATFVDAVATGDIGVVYSFPKGYDRFPNGDTSSTADTVGSSAGYGSTPYSFPRSGFRGLARQGCLDMEPSVFDEMQFGCIRHISQMKQISIAVGCGTGSGSGSIVVHTDGGYSGSDILGRERSSDPCPTWVCLITKKSVRNTGMCLVGMSRKSRLAPNKDLGMVQNTIQAGCWRLRFAGGNVQLACPWFASNGAPMAVI